MGLACIGILHLLCIAMICGQKDRSAQAQYPVNDLTHAAVHHFHCLHRCLKYAGMADHIRIGEIEYDQIIPAGIETGKELVPDLISAHLGLQVIGSHLWRGYKHPILSRIDLFLSPIEKVGDMGILLSLSYPQLL